MHVLRTYFLAAVAASLLMLASSCSSQLKNQLDLRTNGFLNDNCFQALLIFEPDDTARGLVARRESSSRKAKQADLRDMAIEILTNYCIDSQMKNGILDKNKKDPDQAGHRTRLEESIRGLTRGGKTVFTYCNETNATVIGYTIFNIGFRKKLEDIIKTPVVIKQDSTNSEPRS